MGTSGNGSNGGNGADRTLLVGSGSRQKLHLTVSLFLSPERQRQRAPKVVADLNVSMDPSPAEAEAAAACAAPPEWLAGLFLPLPPLKASASAEEESPHDAATPISTAPPPPPPTTTTTTTTTTTVGGSAADHGCRLLLLRSWRLLLCGRAAVARLLLHEHWLVPPFPPRGLVTAGRIHWQAVLLKAKGLAFVPNTGWSSNACPSSFSSFSSFSSSCPFDAPLFPNGGGNGNAGGASARSPPMLLERATLVLLFFVLAAAARAGWITPSLAFAATLGSVFVGLPAVGALLPPDVTGRRLWA
jgi:hypothetical protein